ncbi:hypothetical protein B0T22DRAFT_65677 [Podospora appendiculata]|uniref:Stress-response A/B barrel domain-containing protein n=1 Tax=Podospora appendiculata TaxID=314037 RepID=A0AAE0XJA5_9PEZI|nr:hypothetical protein B0T22DRAFT_65677 [Podospora appendiculata]
MAVSATSRVHRTTMFKIPDPENQKKLLEAYRVLESEQTKGGKPYILQVRTGLAGSDPRSKGYTVIAETEFASLDDMKYYDSECAAHANLKKTASTLSIAEPPLAVYFEE